MPNATSLSALLLLALAGGFVFASTWLPTRYRISRAQGQEIYFYAADYGARLLVLSLLLFWGARKLIPDPLVEEIDKLWGDILGPLAVPALPPFVGAFVLGLVGARLLNALSDPDNTSRRIIQEHGSQLEQFLYDSIVEARLLYVAFDNKKVYVGWAALQPKLKPRPNDPTEYFGLLPVRSGYLDEKTLQPCFTTQYGPVYQQILDGTLEELDMTDFEILLPMDKVVVIRPYSLNLPQQSFAMTSEQPEGIQGPSGGTSKSGLLHTLLSLLIVWRITR